MNKGNTWNTLFQSLQAQPRRRLLTSLAAHEPTDKIHFTELRADESVPGTPIHAEYVHIHLPKLADAGYITWNQQTHEISQGTRFDEVEPFLELVQTHSERLPDGWV